ncbi:hypothetical protein NUU61_002484 [Penicillium alfredii]|uniref:RNase III domain-containing protein n=1 Tax=Penicillium alfredii TaxID=1506179 RepID=A0A9W9KHB9_9EURO|nr:uncharacterized protein NUU61_002484 [Penicillium alfredii]KAJ5105137.1 hypothetical protein NUU61_002484 [Penicillium alfredii]
MKSKRSTPSSASDTPGHSVKKNKVLASDGRSVEEADAGSRLVLLKRLVGEVISSPVAAKVEPEALRAISLLDDIFRQSSKDAGADADMTRSPSAIPHASKASGENIGPCTPALPPILDDGLERAVFTHPAHSNNARATYDRLEILGDAYIELIATKIIWEWFPDIPSGRISQIRELLVKNETLAGFAESYGFDRRASVPPNYSDQPKRWIKTKGDIFEAYVAAVIISDSVDGYRIAERWLSDLWLPTLHGLGHQKAELRSKEALAKKVMGKGIKLEYIEERPSVQHRGGTQSFFIGVYLTGWGWKKRHLGSGQGLSKVAAGDEAARQALLDTQLILEITAAKQSWDSRQGTISC